MAKKNLSQIVKKTITTPKQELTPVGVVNKEVKVVDKGSDRKMTEEERDIKAKETIKTLLHDVVLPDIGSSKSVFQDVEETVEDIPDTAGEIEWFNEQILTLNQIIDNQRIEIEKLNQSAINFNQYGTNDAGEVMQSAINLFIEIQNVYDNLKRANGELIIYPLQFLDKMVTFFPFLQQYRRQLIGEM